jgi:signal transduction histidine kinase
MALRTAIIAGLLMLAMIVGGWFPPSCHAANSPADLSYSHPRAAHSDSLRPPNISEISEKAGHQVFNFAIYLLTNKELLLYGGIAVFGILMVALVIASASSPPKNKSDAILAVLKQEKERAEHLARLKSEFLNQVSHELRTPLAVIIGYIECMTDGLYGEIQAKHHEILQVVAKQSSHLKNMIDQILIYSRLESSKQAIRIEQISLGKLISDLRDTFDFLCRQKGIELQWNVSPKLTTMVSDAERLKEILSNLLQNALKYTDTGSISVRVEPVSSTDSILFEVSDTGMGIPQHYLTTIFEPFIQVHKTSTEQSRGGIGLGLSIVKKHLEQIKGTITVDSEMGKGSTFRIVLPRVLEGRQLRRRRLFTLIKTPFFRVDKNPSVGVDRRKETVQEVRKTSQVL